jgi:hypothetical protein
LAHSQFGLFIEDWKQSENTAEDTKVEARRRSRSSLADVTLAGFADVHYGCSGFVRFVPDIRYAGSRD